MQGLVEPTRLLAASGCPEDAVRVTLAAGARLGGSCAIALQPGRLPGGRDVVAGHCPGEAPRGSARDGLRTREFLDRAIDSSVDAIVAADMQGRVLLFNRAASTIFGYDPGEVVDRMNVSRLYPEGVARAIMRDIRAPSHGGVNRLTDHRVSMLGSDGQPIAVKMSATLILAEGRALGSVGVFTDVRERLKMEKRLSEAREELRQQEKLVAVAQMAGTAARELNQPLTAILGYAGLLVRQLADREAAKEAAQTLSEQAQRMADIARKMAKHPLRNARIRRGHPHRRPRSLSHRRRLAGVSHAGQRGGFALSQAPPRSAPGSPPVFEPAGKRARRGTEQGEDPGGAGAAAPASAGRGRFALTGR